jgi:hypothetical protein
MKQIDPTVGEFIDASLDFGDSPAVDHTVYFAQAGVAQQLRGWLMDEQAREGFVERHGLLSVRPSPESGFTTVRFHENEGRRPVPQPEMRARSMSRRAARSRRAGSDPDTALAALPQPTARAISAAAAEHLTRLFGERLATEPMKASDLGPAASRARAGRRGVAPEGGIAASSREDRALRPRAYAPKLEERSQQCSTLDRGRRIQVVSFRQTHRSIPIFGARATVELDEQSHLVAARAKLGRVEGVSERPQLSARAALNKLLLSVAPLAAKESTALGKRVASDPPPLTFFYDRAQRKWHLAYVFSDIPSVPAHWRSAKRAGARERKRKAGRRFHSRHGVSSPRERFPVLDYLVDAHDGSVVYYYSVSPFARKSARKKRVRGATKSVPVFVRGRGIDEDGNDQLISSGGFKCGSHSMPSSRHAAHGNLAVPSV